MLMILYLFLLWIYVCLGTVVVTAGSVDSILSRTEGIRTNEYDLTEQDAEMKFNEHGTSRNYISTRGRDKSKHEPTAQPSEMPAQPTPFPTQLTFSPTAAPTTSTVLHLAVTMLIGGIDLSALALEGQRSLQEDIKNFTGVITSVPDIYIGAPLLTTDESSSLRLKFQSDDARVSAAFVVVAPFSIVSNALSSKEVMSSLNTADNIASAFSLLLYTDNGSAFADYMSTRIVSDPILSIELDVSSIYMVAQPSVSGYISAVTPTSSPSLRREEIPLSALGTVAIIIGGCAMLAIVCCFGVLLKARNKDGRRRRSELTQLRVVSPNAESFPLAAAIIVPSAPPASQSMLEAACKTTVDITASEVRGDKREVIVVKQARPVR
jgi:hypothetical protein